MIASSMTDQLSIYCNNNNSPMHLCTLIRLIVRYKLSEIKNERSSSNTWNAFLFLRNASIKSTKVFFHCQQCVIASLQCKTPSKWQNVNHVIFLARKFSSLAKNAGKITSLMLQHTRFNLLKARIYIVSSCEQWTENHAADIEHTNLGQSCDFIERRNMSCCNYWPPEQRMPRCRAMTKPANKRSKNYQENARRLDSKYDVIFENKNTNKTKVIFHNTDHSGADGYDDARHSHCRSELRRYRRAVFRGKDDFQSFRGRQALAQIIVVFRISAQQVVARCAVPRTPLEDRMTAVN